jgi:hypothetical protein
MARARGSWNRSPCSSEGTSISRSSEAWLRTSGSSEAMFDRGASALHALSPSVQDVYGCPLCLRGFSKDEVEADGMLSDEHAPPESLGGEVVCLTCRDCNSSAGSQLDFHMKHREALIDFLASTPMILMHGSRLEV